MFRFRPAWNEERQIAFARRLRNTKQFLGLEQFRVGTVRESSATRRVGENFGIGRRGNEQIEIDSTHAWEMMELAGALRRLAGIYWLLIAFVPFVPFDCLDIAGIGRGRKRVLDSIGPIMAHVLDPLFVGNLDGHHAGPVQAVRLHVAGHNPPVECSVAVRPAHVVPHQQVNRVVAIQVFCEQHVSLPVLVIRDASGGVGQRPKRSEFGHASVTVVVAAGKIDAVAERHIHHPRSAVTVAPVGAEPWQKWSALAVKIDRSIVHCVEVPAETIVPEKDVRLELALRLAAENGAHAFVALRAKGILLQRFEWMAGSDQRQRDVPPAGRAENVRRWFALLLPAPSHQRSVMGIVQPPRVTADHDGRVNYARSAPTNGMVNPFAAHARLFRGKHVGEINVCALGPVQPLFVIRGDLGHARPRHRRPERRVAHGVPRGIER